MTIVYNGQDAEKALQKEKEKLERLKIDPPALKQLKEDFWEARKNNRARSYIEDLEQQIRDSEAVGKSVIDRVQARIDELQSIVDAEVTRNRRAARAEFEEKMAKAQKSWLDGGGTQSSFDLVRPEIEKQILMKDTLEVLAEPNPKKKTITPL